MASASTILIHSVVVGRDELFPAFYCHVWKLCPGSYCPFSPGTGTDYPVAPIGQVPERKESQSREEGVEGVGNLINIGFSDLKHLTKVGLSIISLV